MLRELRPDQWTVEQLSSAYDAWLVTGHRKGRRPDTVSAATALHARIHGYSWRSAASQAGFSSDPSAKNAAERLTRRLGIYDLVEPLFDGAVRSTNSELPPTPAAAPADKRCPLHDLPIADWTVERIADVYAPAVAAESARNPHGEAPSVRRAAVVVHARLRLASWNDCARLAGYGNAGSARRAARRLANILHLQRILHPYIHGRVRTRRPVNELADAPAANVDDGERQIVAERIELRVVERLDVVDDTAELARDCARVIWWVARARGGVVTGAPRDVAERLRMLPLPRAERALRALHHARAIRFSPFERPDGRTRWSVSVPLEVRGESVPDTEQQAA